VDDVLPERVAGCEPPLDRDEAGVGIALERDEEQPASSSPVRGSIPSV